MSKIKTEVFEQLNEIKFLEGSGLPFRIRDITLVGLQLDDDDIANLLEALETNVHPIALNVASNAIGEKGAKALANNKQIIYLNINNNNIGIEGAKVLAQSNHITHLEAIGNNIGAEGAKAFANNKKLLFLDISRNNITDEGAKAFANNETLLNLDISENNITDEGAKAFAKNETLLNLGISENNITDEGAKALTNNNSLLEIKGRWSNKFSDPIMQELEKALKLNKKAKELTFIEQVIEVAKGSRLSQTNSQLKRLPSDLLLMVLSYAANYAIRSPREVQEVCQFLLQTIKSSSKGTLDWSQAKTKFFKEWDPVELQKVKERSQKQAASLEPSSEQDKSKKP
jgi:hypothetical protein